MGELQRKHSPLHHTRKAACRTQWEQMIGSDQIRICPRCKVSAFRAEDLNDDEITDLIRTIAPTQNQRELRLFRKLDGTFTVANLECAPYSPWPSLFAALGSLCWLVAASFVLSPYAGIFWRIIFGAVTLAVLGAIMFVQARKRANKLIRQKPDERQLPR